MTDGFILMKSGSQWNLVRVENGDGISVGAILARPLAERIATLLNRFGEEDIPLPIDESQFAPDVKDDGDGCLTSHQDEDA